MSRKNRQDHKRYIAPDAKYDSAKVSKFINRIMMQGKKRIAERIMYDALQKLETAVNTPALKAFETALSNVMPLMEVRSRRVGGSTYQVPMEVKSDRAMALAMRWLIANSRSRSGKPMGENLGSELIDAFNKVGTSIKKREETHKMAEANKAFAHFRW